MTEDTLTFTLDREVFDALDAENRARYWELRYLPANSIIGNGEPTTEPSWAFHAETQAPGTFNATGAGLARPAKQSWRLDLLVPFPTRQEVDASSRVTQQVKYFIPTEPDLDLGAGHHIRRPGILDDETLFDLRWGPLGEQHHSMWEQPETKYFECSVSGILLDDPNDELRGPTATCRVLITWSGPRYDSETPSPGAEPGVATSQS